LSTPFQNRLVGTVIVAAVAIIFLPDLLDGNKKKHDAEFENIPQAPKIEFNAQIEPFPEDKLKKSPENNTVEVEQDTVLELAINDNETSNDTQEMATTAVNTAKNNTAKVIKDGNVKIQTLKKETLAAAPAVKPVTKEKKALPKKINVKASWVIQLGSFRHKKNVSALIDKLKYHGYTTFTRPIKTKNGVLTKVFVGPNMNKASLDSKIVSLKSLTNVQGKVTRFYPAKL